MADYAFLNDSGVIVPDTADLLAEVQAEFRTALGADLIVTPDTPQGVLITAETLARDAVVRNNAALANQINPNLAGGSFLDALWALTGGARVQATRSVITGATVAGVAGAIIPQGARASVGPAGDLFETTGAVTLGVGGTATVSFQSVEYGPIAAAPGALNTVVSGVLGWETVTNADAAVLGTDTESDQAARQRRRNTLALQGVALPEAITSGLYATEGVTSVLFRENYTSADVVEEGVTIKKHSVYVCVDGGTDQAVANALLQNKSLGCDWSGSTTVNVLEPVSGQTYAVKFRRPTSVPIFIEITVRPLAAGSSNPAQIVRDAIELYAAGGLEGEPGLVIGQDVSPFEIAGAVNRAAPDLYVSLCKVGTAPGVTSTTPVSITIAQRAQIIAGNITVSVV